MCGGSAGGKGERKLIDPSGYIMRGGIGWIYLGCGRVLYFTVPDMISYGERMIRNGGTFFVHL